jgi:hypothetical protein
MDCCLWKLYELLYWFVIELEFLVINNKMENVLVWRFLSLRIFCYLSTDF